MGKLKGLRTKKTLNDSFARNKRLKAPSFSQKAVSFILLVSMFLQSCGNYAEIRHAGGGTEKIISEYAQNISKPEERANFIDRIQPILTKKLESIESESEQKEILHNVLSTGFLDENILEKFSPIEWTNRLEKDFINKILEEIPVFQNNNILRDYVDQAYWTTLNFDDTKSHINAIIEFNKKIDSLSNIQEAFLIVKKFNPQKNTYSTLLEVIENSTPQNIVDKVQKALIESTFESDFELSLNQIAEKISQTSKYSEFVSSAENIISACEKIKQRLDSQSDYASQLNFKKISDWSVEDIREWSVKIKNNSIFPIRDEIIAGVFRAAEIKNGFKTRNTQLVALLSLLNKPSNLGRLAQINTGEGKSLIVAMLAAVLALQGKKVDVVTTSMELAIPEVDKQKSFFEILNLSVDHNEGGEKRGKYLYAADIVYGTAGNFQGDILRTEFMLNNIRTARPFECVIVDEVDSMLFDDRNYCTQLSSITPAAQHFDSLIAMAWQYANKLKNHLLTYEGKIFFIKDDFEISNGKIKISSGNHIDDVKVEMPNFTEFIQEEVKKHLTQLTRYIYNEERIAYEDYKKLNEKFAELSLRIERGDGYVPDVHTKFEDYYTLFPWLNNYEKPKNKKEEIEFLKNQLQNHRWHKYYPKIDLPPHLQGFVQTQIDKWAESVVFAMFYKKKGIHYTVANNKIAPIDHTNTGVIQKNMVWSNGLAQFLQIKEGLPIESEGISTNFISAVGFFKRYGENLYGLTGTIGNEDSKKFFEEVYHTDNVTIPTYKFRPVAGNEHSQYVCKELPAVVCSSENEWISEIVKTNLLHARCGQGILIICENIQTVYKIAQKLQQNYDPNKIFKYTGETSFKKDTIDAGEIIVATSIAGRGTDITTTSSVEKNGGMHVCVTVLPASMRVELQNVGRTARQGKKGTAQLIILSDNHKDISTIKDLREEQENKKVNSAKEEIQCMVFKDRIFEKFCSLSGKIIPNKDEAEKQRQFLELKKLLEIFKMSHLQDYQIEKDFQDRSKKAIEEVYNANIANEETEINRRFDELAVDFQKKYSQEAQSQLKTMVENGRKEAIEAKRKNFHQDIEKLILSQPNREEHKKNYLNNSINLFLDARKANYSPEVVDFVRSGKTYMPKGNNYMNGANWGEYERLAIEERWGFWMKKNLDTVTKSSLESVGEAFTSFQKEIENDAINNTLIENPIYFIKKGNSRPTYNWSINNDRADSAIKCYNRAINLDPRNAANAHYNKALHLLNHAGEDTTFSEAKYHLRMANFLIEAYAKNDTLTLYASLMIKDSESLLGKKVMRRLNILQKQQDYIQMAIDNILAAESKEWNVSVDSLTLDEAFKDADENHDDVIAEASVNGLPWFFKVTPKQPTNYSGLFLCALLGVLQVVVGVVLLATPAAHLGVSLISEGVSDICSSFKSIVTDGKFSWKEYGIAKAGSLLVAAVCWGWDAIKGASKALVGSVKEAFTSNVTKDILVNSIKNTAIKTTISASVNYLAEETFCKDADKLIFEKVLERLQYLLQNSQNITKAVRLDNKHEINSLQNRILSKGSELLKEKRSEVLEFFKSVTKGVLSKQVNYASEIFKVAEISSGVTEMLTFTDRFVNNLNHELANDANFSSLTKELDASEPGPETKFVDKYEEAIREMNDGDYTTKQDTKTPKQKAISSSKLDKIAYEFASTITTGLQAKFRSAVLSPAVDSLANFGVKVINSASDDIEKSRKALRASYEGYCVHEAFGGKTLAQKQQEEQVKQIEKLVKDLQIQQEKLIEKQSQPKPLILPKASYSDLFEKANKREIFVNSINSDITHFGISMRENMTKILNSQNSNILTNSLLLEKIRDFSSQSNIFVEKYGKYMENSYRPFEEIEKLHTESSDLKTYWNKINDEIKFEEEKYADKIRIENEEKARKLFESQNANRTRGPSVNPNPTKPSTFNTEKAQQQPNNAANSNKDASDSKVTDSSNVNLQKNSKNVNSSEEKLSSNQNFAFSFTDYKKRGDLFDKIFGDINIKKTHSIDDHFANLGKTNSAISSIENYLSKLDATGAQLLFNNSPDYPQILQAKQTMLKKLIDGVTKKAEISSIIGLEHKDFEKKTLAKENLREVNNELKGLRERAVEEKTAIKRNHRGLKKYFIDDNENSSFEQKMVETSKKNLEDARAECRRLCDLLGEEYISSGDEDNIFSSGEFKQFREFRSSVQKDFKLITSTAFDHITEHAFADLLKEGAIFTAASSLGAVGLTMYGATKVVDFALSLPALKDHIENIIENYDDIPHETKIETGTKLACDFILGGLLKSGKNVAQNDTLRVCVKEEIKRVANMTEFFKKTEFGRELKKFSTKTGKISITNENIYRVSSKNSLNLKKGDYFYIDRAHDDYFHLEVYDFRGKAKSVLNLRGEIDLVKTNKAIEEGRTINI